MDISASAKILVEVTGLSVKPPNAGGTEYTLIALSSSETGQLVWRGTSAWGFFYRDSSGELQPVKLGQELLWNRHRGFSLPVK